MFQVVFFLMFFSVGFMHGSQAAESGNQKLFQPKPLTTNSDQYSFLISQPEASNSTNLYSKSFNSETKSANFAEKNDESKESSCKLSLAGATTCLLVAQRRHSKWCSSSSRRVSSNQIASSENTASLPQGSNQSKIEFGNTLLVERTETTNIIDSDTEEEQIDYQKKCEESLNEAKRAQEELMASLTIYPKKEPLLVKKDTQEQSKKADDLKNSLKAYNFPQDTHNS